MANVEINMKDIKKACDDINTKIDGGDDEVSKEVLRETLEKFKKVVHGNVKAQTMALDNETEMLEQFIKTKVQNLDNSIKAVTQATSEQDEIVKSNDAKID